MNLKVPIRITDELTEDIINATGLLDLASGEIGNVTYEDYDVAAQGVPVESPDYEFTSGTLSHDGKEVEFRIDVDQFSGAYSVSASELLEIKVRAAQLFSGVNGQALALLAGGQDDAPRRSGGAAAKAPARKAARKTARRS
ncbi:MAG: hypothetical protein RLZZ584_2670 [Pseudomonadota bacterium]